MEESNRRIAESASSTTTNANLVRATMRWAFEEMKFDVEQLRTTLSRIDDHFFASLSEDNEGAYEETVGTTINRMHGAFNTLNMQTAAVHRQIIQKLSTIYPNLPQPPAAPLAWSNVNATSGVIAPVTAATATGSLTPPETEEHEHPNDVDMPDDHAPHVSSVGPAAVATLTTPKRKRTIDSIRRNKRKLEMTPSQIQMGSPIRRSRELTLKVTETCLLRYHRTVIQSKLGKDSAVVAGGCDSQEIAEREIPTTLMELNAVIKVECTEADAVDTRISQLPHNPNEVQLVDDEVPGGSGRVNAVVESDCDSEELAEREIARAIAYENDEEIARALACENDEEIARALGLESEEEGQQESEFESEQAEASHTPNREPEKATPPAPAEVDPKLNTIVKVKLDKLGEAIEDELEERDRIVVPVLSDTSVSEAMDDNAAADGEELDDKEMRYKLLAAAIRRLARSVYKKATEATENRNQNAGESGDCRKKRKISPKSKMRREPDSESELCSTDGENEPQNNTTGPAPSTATATPNADATVEDGIDLGSDEESDEETYRRRLLEPSSEEQLIADAESEEPTQGETRNRKFQKTQKPGSNKRRRQERVSDISDMDMSSDEEAAETSSRPEPPQPAPEPRQVDPMPNVCIINTEDESDSEIEILKITPKKVVYVSSNASSSSEHHERPNEVQAMNEVVAGPPTERHRRQSSSSDYDVTDEDGDDSSSDSDSPAIEWLGSNFPLPRLKTVIKNEAGDNEDMDVINEQMEVDILPSPVRRFDPLSPDPSVATPRRNTGRRNIRAVQPDELDLLETRRARQDEEERRKRVAEQREQDEILSMRRPQPGLVLEHDEANENARVEVHYGIASRLKPHQKDGIKFMWKACFETQDIAMAQDGSGCVLAHCMGLGKTVQVFALVHTILRNPVLKTKFKSALVACPLTVIQNWNYETRIWQEENIVSGEHIPVYILSCLSSLSEFTNVLRKWKESGGLAVIHYDLLRALFPEKLNAKQRVAANLGQEAMDLCKECLLSPGPDLTALDEGHVLKNPRTRNWRIINSIKTKRKIILTGTPMQNNLKEYFSMIQLIKPRLLGSWKEFSNRFVNPIKNGQWSNSLPEDVTFMKHRTHVLSKLVAGCVHRVPVSVLIRDLPPKKEYTIGVKLTSKQKELYNEYLRCIENRRMLEDYNTLVKIVAHPIVLKEQSTKCKPQAPVDIEDCPDTYSGSDDEGLDRTQGQWFHAILSQLGVDFASYEMSGKLIVLRSILKYCQEIGEKVLLFSQFHSGLNQIETMLEEFRQAGSYNYYRLDGNTSIKQRTEYIQNFNDPVKGVSLLLLSTKVASLGLNLTGASRVIVFDASWNPFQDMQAVFRAYRYGQTRTCHIYRLLGQHTMEERVYNTQVVKLALSFRIVDEKQIERHIARNPQEEDLMYKPYPEENEEENEPGREAVLSVAQNDPLLTKLVQDHSTLVHSIREHDSLLQDDENLTAEQKNTAWEQFRNDTRNPAPDPSGTGRPRVRPKKPVKVVVGKLPFSFSKTIYAHLPQRYGQDTDEMNQQKITYQFRSTKVEETHSKARDTSLRLEARIQAYKKFKEAKFELEGLLLALGLLRESELFEVLDKTFPTIPALEVRSLVPGSISPRPESIQEVQNAVNVFRSGTWTSPSASAGAPPRPPPSTSGNNSALLP